MRHLHIGVPAGNFVSTLRVSTSLKTRHFSIIEMGRGVARCSIYLVQDCSLRFVCISPPLPPVINKEVDYRVGCTPATKLRTWEAGWNPNLTTGLYLSGCGMRHTHWLISYFQLWHAPHLLAHQSLAGCVATTPIIMHLFTGCVAGYP